MKLSPLIITAVLALTMAHVRAQSFGDYQQPPPAEGPRCTLACQNGGFCAFEAPEGTTAGAGDDFFPTITAAPDYGPMHCECPSEWSGARCDDAKTTPTEDYCKGEENPCQNGSKCVIATTAGGLNKGLSCDCSTTTEKGIFDGKYCQYKANEICVLTGMMENGAKTKAFCVHGVCKRFLLSPDKTHPGCNCKKNWTGSRCEIALSTGEELSLPAATIESYNPYTTLYTTNENEDYDDDDDDDDDDVGYDQDAAQAALNQYTTDYDHESVEPGTVDLENPYAFNPNTEAEADDDDDDDDDDAAFENPSSFNPNTAEVEADDDDDDDDDDAAFENLSFNPSTAEGEADDDDDDDDDAATEVESEFQGDDDDDDDSVMPISEPCGQDGLYCFHGAVCMQLGSEGFQCDCSTADDDAPAQFSGTTNCEYRATDFCEEGDPGPVMPRSFCTNGGICESRVLSQEHAGCLCPNGFAGSHCEISVVMAESTATFGNGPSFPSFPQDDDDDDDDDSPFAPTTPTDNDDGADDEEDDQVGGQGDDSVQDDDSPFAPTAPTDNDDNADDDEDDQVGGQGDDSVLDDDNDDDSKPSFMPTSDDEADDDQTDDYNSKPGFLPAEDDDDSADSKPHWAGDFDDDDAMEEEDSKTKGGVVFLAVVASILPCVFLVFAANKLAKMWRQRKATMTERSAWLSRGGYSDEQRDINVFPRRDSVADAFPPRQLHLSSRAPIALDGEVTRAASSKTDEGPYRDDPQDELEQVSMHGIEMC